MTLVAGLASTVFAPLTAWLLGPLGWQHTYVVLAAFVAVTAVVHAGGYRNRGRSPYPAWRTSVDPTGKGRSSWSRSVDPTSGCSSPA